MDLARALAMVAVALGHWLVTDVRVAADGSLALVDVLAVVPAMQPLTWVFQVMPVFFFAGGVVSFRSWRRHRAVGRSAGSWISARLWRLAWPTVLVVGAWVVATQVAGRVLDVPAEVLAATRGIALVTWFLAVYALVIALVPVFAALCDRFGLGVPVGLLVAALGVDLAAAGAAGDVPAWAFVNYLTVWGAITCVGRWWPESIRPGDTRRGLALAGAAGAVLVGAVAAGAYPLSMVGVAGAERTNSWPPTLALALLGLVQVGLLLAARPALDRWLARPRVYGVVGVLGARAMTIYLWHPLAVAVLTLALVVPGAWPEAAYGTAAWWALRVAWVVLALFITVPVVVAVGRWERPPDLVLTSSTARAVAAAVALSVGWTALAVFGFHVAALPFGLPWLALGGLGVGILLLRGRSGSPAGAG
nr:acyltransferase [Salsipaludibacter albus]